MHKLMLAAVASLFAANMVLAQAPAAPAKKDATATAPAEKKADAKAKPAEKKLTPQQGKMKACNGEAAEKKLKGDERKAFMKECLSGAKK